MTHRRLVLLTTLFASAALAQFSQLRPTDDGSQVYFLSTLPLTAEAQLNLPATGAIYRFQGGSITRVTDPPASPANCGLDCHSQGNPQISGDGSVFSYTNYTYCGGHVACLVGSTTGASTVVVGGKPYATLTGDAQVSANGRFVYSAQVYPPSVAPAQANVSQLLDLQTGTTYPVPIMAASSRQTLTNDGRVLLFPNPFGQTLSLALWSTQGLLPIATAEQPVTAIISPNGAWVVYETSGPTIRHLRAVNLSSGNDVLLAISGSSFGASISNDGSEVLYLRVPGIAQTVQAFTIHPDGTGNTQLTNFAQAVDEAVIAGSGAIAFAVTGGRLEQIDVPGGAVQELIGRTPVCTAMTVSLVPGSIYPLDGTAMADSTASAPTPLPTSLGEVRMLANGAAWPILSVTPFEVWFQVPFETATGSQITLRLDHASLFEGCPAQSIPVVDRYGSFFSPSGLVAVHQDFSGLVGLASPAQPNEIIHTYATGVGAVTPAMTTGVPTPIGQLFPAAQPLQCYMLAGNVAVAGPPLNVTFAGLAPGMIGVYQVDVQIPYVQFPGTGEGYITVNCAPPSVTGHFFAGEVYVSGLTGQPSCH